MKRSGQSALYKLRSCCEKSAWVRGRRPLIYLISYLKHVVTFVRGYGGLKCDFCAWVKCDFMRLKSHISECIISERGDTMKGGYIFYDGWMRGLNFVNGNEDDTIRFLIAFVDGDYYSEKVFREMFREEVKRQNVKINDIEGSIDKVIEKMDVKPWEC